MCLHPDLVECILRHSLFLRALGRINRDSICFFFFFFFGFSEVLFVSFRNTSSRPRHAPRPITEIKGVHARTRKEKKEFLVPLTPSSNPPTLTQHHPLHSHRRRVSTPITLLIRHPHSLLDTPLYTLTTCCDSNPSSCHSFHGIGSYISSCKHCLRTQLTNLHINTLHDTFRSPFIITKCTSPFATTI